MSLARNPLMRPASRFTLGLPWLGANREPEAVVSDEEVVIPATELFRGYRPGPAKPRSWLAAIALKVAQTSKRTEARRRTLADEDKNAEAVWSSPPRAERVRALLAGTNAD